jgi:hypothetical protein
LFRKLFGGVWYFYKNCKATAAARKDRLAREARKKAAKKKAAKKKAAKKK